MEPDIGVRQLTKVHNPLKYTHVIIEGLAIILLRKLLDMVTHQHATCNMQNVGSTQTTEKM